MPTRLFRIFILCAALPACSFNTVQVPWPEQTPPQGSTTPDSTASDTEMDPAAEPPADEPVRVAIATPESVNRERAPQQQTVTGSLRQQAASARADGEAARAELLLERALRIAPREAATYFDLATLKLEQGAPGRALQLARKGLSLRPSADLAQRLRVVEADAATLLDN